jgi:hypothetical protein
MRLALLITAVLALAVAWQAPAPIHHGVGQALAAQATSCPEPSEEGGADEASHVRQSGSDSGAGGGEEGSDEDAPPKFSNSFHRRWISMDASLDGFTPPELPTSIEAVCDVPKRLQRQADQLNGTDGVVVVGSKTVVVKDGKTLSGTSRLAELDGADTAFMKVRLFRPNKWREDEDGDKIPTFRAKRITITD